MCFFFLTSLLARVATPTTIATLQCLLVASGINEHIIQTFYIEKLYIQGIWRMDRRKF